MNNLPVGSLVHLVLMSFTWVPNGNTFDSPRAGKYCSIHHSMICKMPIFPLTPEMRRTICKRTLWNTSCASDTQKACGLIVSRISLRGSSDLLHHLIVGIQLLFRHGQHPGAYLNREHGIDSDRLLVALDCILEVLCRNAHVGLVYLVIR